MPITTYVFDAYGTLFDVNAAAQAAASEEEHADLQAIWPQLAADWRRKQVEYSWLRAVARRHCDFWRLTEDGLDWAMAAQGIDNPATRKRLLELYWELAAFPEVPGMLADLKTAGKHTAILSNGSPTMLAAAVKSADIGGQLDAVLSVESVGVFKPDARVYDLVQAHFDCDRTEVLFVSANGWDAAAGAGYGFETAWINRAGDPVDNLYASPHHVLPDLTTIPEIT